MDRDELEKLNNAIASLHGENDVASLNIDNKKQIKFPRGFLRTFDYYRDYFPYIEDQALLTRIVSHLMHRDTLHWLWLKTDLFGDARFMVVKFQLVTLASVLEGVVKNLIPKAPKNDDSMYWRIDQLQSKGLITNGVDLKQLWYDRNSIHLHLDKYEKNPVNYTDVNYIKWHEATRIFMQDLKSNYPAKQNKK
jgi:hypothetical protein